MRCFVHDRVYVSFVMCPHFFSAFSYSNHILHILCEFIGIYIQPLLMNMLSKDNMGLYRDDRLFILCKINKQQTERVRKKAISFFKNIDFKIETVTNLTEVEFLDVTFNLENNACSTALRCGSFSEKTSIKSTCAVMRRIIITFGNKIFL